ncbi:MAG: histidinol-phosphate transaminase [Coriobacteriales bacterium]|jgi:histidinol-phosphate aminotransferase|nr:histidinol-phosphate transaminase [Coriobacteriales bacterium]
MNWHVFFNSQLKKVKPYEPGLREEQVRAIAQTNSIHKLSSNESPFPPFPRAIEAMTACLPYLNEYSDGSVHELKQALAEKHGVEPSQIVVGNGVNELLCLLAQSCLDETSHVAYCWPSFVVYRMSAQIAGATFDEVDIDADGAYDLDGLRAAIRPHTKLVYLCSPNNPTGGIVKREQFAAFIKAVPRHVCVVVDMAYAEYVESPEHLDPMAFFDGKRPLVVFRSFSKIYGLAGVRCGYGIAPVPVVQAIDKVREPFNVNTVAQVGALASLSDAGELERRRTENSRQRARLYKIFQRLNLRYYQSEANFVWVFVPDAQLIFEELLKRGIIVRPFAAAGGLRVGVGTPEATLATIEAFEHLFC